ncbi:bifunctional ADP-dependent NAD(P)H-hydrate dehydratase/NAD(P)H-hydrate epimerase [Salimicrobium flavidum]|uniref:Bifunctional NAD(P)H-hydrate repair enzyme n=1 Tax=Salimicrobium flavidum TaxID=570947 RepID=A0A1N7K5A4_9BACI|nr:bifunctional ADP-dependent NAD(P)H-hydrate dehydratase/NAD(P)H-hydrate epimerase [Salimicrobium flavidum]SIS56759.1 NAD(P)H-hydrate epimerase [Salimicrobium flavidum]
MQVLRAEEMYDWDRKAMESYGREGQVLMENAGRAIAEEILRKFPETEKFLIVIGGGNNGGDGYVIARILKDRRRIATAVQVVPDEKIKGDALYHKRVYEQSGYSLSSLSEEVWNENTVLVDAMLGIGVKGALRAPFDELVSKVNESQMHRISVDIPSGLPADEGVKEFQAVKADTTYIVQAPKQSLFLDHTAGYYGEWKVLDIGLPPMASPKVSREIWTEGAFAESFPVLPGSAHKGTRGKGLIVGGGRMMPGALMMAARASIRAGAGLTTAATVRDIIPYLTPSLPEAMFAGTGESSGVISSVDPEVLEGKDAVAVGVGMGREPESRPVIEMLLSRTSGPLLIDADGLYHLRFLLDDLKKRQEVTVLTPHFGEMAHLTGEEVSEVKRNPFSLSRSLAYEYGVYLVLKGPNTIITTPEGSQIIEPSGNEGLSKGGSGDVLTGVLLTMLMQHESPVKALANGCFLHGRTAELLISKNRTVLDLLPTDLTDGLSLTYRTFLPR